MRADYQARLLQLQVDADHARIAQNLAFNLLIASLAAFIIFFVLAGQRRTPGWSVVLPIPVIPAVGRWYAITRARWLRSLRLHGFYERGLARIDDRWHGSGFSGEEFRAANHVYDTDLQILGEGSMFELLCTARTGIGRRRLAMYLLDPCDRAESQARQASVRELRPFTGLREQIALLGKYDFQKSTWQVFSEWTGTAAVTAPAWVRAIAFAASAILGGLVLAGFATSIPWSVLAPLIPPVLTITSAIAWYYRKRTASLNAAAGRMGVEIRVAREGIELITKRTFGTPKLAAIKQCLNNGNAAAALRQLERLTNAIAECDKPYFGLPAQFLIVRTQLCFAIEQWKSLHAKHLRNWLDAWGEFEALAAISGYAAEHPDDIFPGLEDGPSSFTAVALGHPLLPSATCVRNDVALNFANRFYVVSGSNMSGKSTLLRSIGLNAVLAKAGAPVRAHSMGLTDLQIFASLSIVDSILEGKSRFFAEVERMRHTLQCARRSQVLFLIDEILSGTNSRDRRIAAESIVRELLGHGAIGVLSTHDLALAEIAELQGLAGANVHMGSRSGEDPMDFDFVLKPGVTTETNALAILAMVTRRC